MEHAKEESMLESPESVGGSVIAPDEFVGGHIKTTYKSYKKKYRKMRIKFDEKMRESNSNFVEEQSAINTARRLAEDNDRLVELLLDMNDSAQMPADKRINLAVESPPIRELQIQDYRAKFAEKDLSVAAQVVWKDTGAMIEEVLVGLKSASSLPKSLARLMATTPHLSSSSALVPADLVSSLEPIEGHASSIQYLTADQLDDYMNEVDASLGTIPVASSHSHGPTQQELALKNPHSVYNWLRRNEPKIFLQDGEGSEKSSGKPGALRGAGKRAMMPAPSKPDSLEIVEEDGLGYDPTISGLEPAKGKRKRDDDGGYHPKSGRVDSVKKPRIQRKKKSDGGEPIATSPKRKGKGKTRVSSPLAAEPVGSVSS